MVNKLLLWNIILVPGNASVSPESLISELGEQARVEWFVTYFLMLTHGDALLGSSVFTHEDGQREFRGKHLRLFFKCLPDRQIVIERLEEVAQAG